MTMYNGKIYFFIRLHLDIEGLNENTAKICNINDYGLKDILKHHNSIIKT